MPGVGDSYIAKEFVVFPFFLQNLRCQVQPGAFSAKAAVAFGSEDNFLQQVIEILYIDEMLDDIDVLELVGEEAADERYLDAAFVGGFRFGIVGGEVIVPPDGVGDFGQGEVAVDHLHEECQFIFLDPFLDHAENIFVAQMIVSDLEGFGADIGQDIVDFLLPGLIEFAEVLVVGGSFFRVDRSHQSLGLLDTAPAEIIQHFPRYALVQVLVGLLQHLHDNAPFGA